MTNLEAFRRIITENGFRLTKAREDTFALLQHPEPQTMKDILLKAESTVDRVSVYRNVALFEKLGIAQRVYFGWKYKIELSDKFLSHHHHLACLGCDSVFDIHDEEHMSEFIRDVSDANGFTPVRHTFEVEGYCKVCSGKK